MHAFFRNFSGTSSREGTLCWGRKGHTHCSRCRAFCSRDRYYIQPISTISQVLLPFLVSSIIFLFPSYFHCFDFSENGKIMTWGWGEHGQLGLGDTNDQTFPHIVNIGYRGHMSGKQIRRVYCGSGFTSVVEPV